MTESMKKAKESLKRKAELNSELEQLNQKLASVEVRIKHKQLEVEEEENDVRELETLTLDNLTHMWTKEYRDKYNKEQSEYQKEVDIYEALLDKRMILKDKIRNNLSEYESIKFNKDNFITLRNKKISELIENPRYSKRICMLIDEYEAINNDIHTLNTVYCDSKALTEKIKVVTEFFSDVLRSNISDIDEAKSQIAELKESLHTYHNELTVIVLNHSEIEYVNKLFTSADTLLDEVLNKNKTSDLHIAIKRTDILYDKIYRIQKMLYNHKLHLSRLRSLKDDDIYNLIVESEQ